MMMAQRGVPGGKGTSRFVSRPTLIAFLRILLVVLAVFVPPGKGHAQPRRERSPEVLQVPSTLAGQCAPARVPAALAKATPGAIAVSVEVGTPPAHSRTLILYSDSARKPLQLSEVTTYSANESSAVIDMVGAKFEPSGTVSGFWVHRVGGHQSDSIPKPQQLDSTDTRLAKALALWITRRCYP
jgi:hypothetical protein